MSISWKKEYDQSVLANMLQEADSSVQGVTSLGDSILSPQVKAVIRSAVSFGEFEIPEAEQFRIVTGAISTVSNSGQLTPNRILAEINRQATSFVGQPNKKFTLLTNFIADNSYVPRAVRILDHTITFSKERPISFDWPAARKLQIHQIVGHKLPPNLLVLRVSGEGRSQIEAADKALDALDFLRGIWNFAININKIVRWSPSPHPPINKVRLGPIHTLHKRNGTLATSADVYWYETDFGPMLDMFHFESVDWEMIKKNERWIRKKLAAHKYKKEVSNAFTRYARGLDSRNLYATFQSLWGILEFLTATQRSRYEDTIRRTAFLSHKDERDYHVEVLKHLREFRNRRVHADVESSEIETLTFQLKFYVEALIRFHLRNRFGFESILDAGEFLQLPYKLDKIDEGVGAAKVKIRRLENAWTNS